MDMQARWNSSLEAQRKPTQARRYLVYLLCELMILQPALVRADPVAANAAMQVYTAPNGVPVVDIAKANSAGLSHNVFTSYNVDSRGIVLNNGNSDQLVRQSQLAGQVTANLNLAQQARVILNEVVAPGRSTLAGYTEVLGGAADVVIANPYGITCNGCGFINTPNVTLSTGLPQFNGSGALSGFQVNGGDILVTGAGLDATKPDYLSLLARSVRLEGQVNARDLTVAAGSGSWDYATRQLTAGAATGTVPAFAVDSTVLGGMYANRIHIQATEAGVGVRMLGDAAATADDFTIDAAGRVVLQGRVSAERDLHVASTAADSQALQLDGASLSARHDVALSATGGMVLKGGLLSAGNDLALEAASLSDTAGAATASNSNQRYATHDITLVTSGAMLLSAVGWGAGNRFDGQVGSLQNNALGTTLRAGNGFVLASQGDLALGLATLQSDGDIDLRAGGALSTLSGATQGLQSTSGNVTLQAAQLDNAGTITADAGTLTARIAGLLDNHGTLHARDTLDIAGLDAMAVTVSNAGTLLADGKLLVDAAAFNNLAGGKVQGTTGTTLTADALDNAGAFIASATSGQAANLTLGTLDNSGSLQSTDDLLLKIGSQGNNRGNGKILAGHDLRIDAAGTATTLNLGNLAGATLQAGNLLQIGSATGNVTLDTQAGDIFGAQLALTLARLNNSGLVQGTGNTTITTANTLTNAGGGRILLASGGGSAIGTLTAGTLSNNGNIQSSGATTINIASVFDNVGTVLGFGDLSLRGRDAGNYTLNNQGGIESRGLLDIKGNGGSRNVTVSVGSNGFLKGGSMDMSADSLSIANPPSTTGGGEVSSTGNMTLNLNTLSLGGSRAKIVGATSGGNTSINLANGFSNPGAVHSGGNLTFILPWLSNYGGISALGTLDLQAAGGLYNAGALYAGGLLKASASSGTFTNYAPNSGFAGTIDSSGDMTLSAQTFVNNSRINAANKLTVSAATFRNEIPGGTSTSWGSLSPVTQTETGHDGKSYIYGCCDQYENWYYSETWNQSQYYTFGAPAFTPQIIGGGDVTIKDFSSGSNVGAIISGYRVFINGGSFVNDSLPLYRRDYTKTYMKQVKYIAAGPATYWNDFGDGTQRNVVNSQNDVFISRLNTGIFSTTTLSISNPGGFVNKDSIAVEYHGISSTVNPTGASANGSAGSVGGGGPVNGAPVIQFPGLDLSLPANPNGYFIPSQDPRSAYLVETNPLFSVGSSYLGSNYLADRLGYDPDTIERRLGDAAYENFLVRQQLIAQTGRNILLGYQSESQQMQTLMENAVAQQNGLGLVFGKAPDAAQLAQLSEDIVWMVETTVGGSKVLAPVVFLSQATRDNIQGGAVLAAQDIRIEGGSLTNTGGTMAATRSLSVITQGDIRNTSGSITAGNMALVSTDGKVINETAVTRSGSSDNYQDVAGKTGSMAASGSLVISGEKGVDIIGAAVTAGDAAVIHSAEGDINIRSLALESKTTTEKHESGLFYSSTEKTVVTDQKKLAATVSAGAGKDAGQLTLLAENGDVNLLSADLASSGGINIKAQDVNALALNLESSRESSKSSSGISASGGALTIGSSASSQSEKTSVGEGSSLKAGGALNILADKDIVLEGGSYAANTVSLEAGGDLITRAAQNTYSATSSSSSSGISMGNGSVGISSRTSSASESALTHSNASMTATDGVALTAGKKVDIGGLDAAVLSKATPADPGEAAAADAAAATVLPGKKATAVTGLDVDKLRAAVASGNAGSFIQDTAAEGLGVQGAMADMKQPEKGQLSITGQEIVSTKVQDEYHKTSETAGMQAGIGVHAGSSENGGSAGISFSAGTDYRKESSSLKADTVNHLSADNVSLEGSKGIALKGVAIDGGSRVVLKSDGDISITAAEVEKQHSLDSRSSHFDLGITAGADSNAGPLNLTGPLTAAATLGFGIDTRKQESRDKLHNDSTLNSGGLLSIESTKGDVTWTGVTATADTLSVKAQNFNSAAYQDSSTLSESGTSLGINLNVGTDVGTMAYTLFKGNGSRSTTLDRKETREAGNTIAANRVAIDAKDNVTIVGGNLLADDVSIRANTVDLKAEKSTLDEHKTEVGVSLVMDGSAAFMGNKAWGSIDSMKEAPESGTNTGGGLADRAGDGRVNNGKAVSDELLSGRTGLSITSTEQTTKGESYNNANLSFNNLVIDTTSAGGSRGDGHVDIGGANLLGKTDASSISIATGELKTTKYVDRQEVTSHDNSTFAGIAVEGHSAIADTINHEKTLQDKVDQGMTLDQNWVAAQRAADASNMAMGDAVGGSVAATIRNVDTQTHSLATSENTTYVNAGNIRIRTTEGNLALNGVEFNAPPVYNAATGKSEKATGARPRSVSLDSAGDISMTAAKSTYQESSTTLTNDFNLTGSASVSGSGSGVGLDAGYNGSFEKNSLDKTTYSNASLAADNIAIKSKNLSLTGANISGGNISIDVEKNISVTSVQDTQTQQTSRGNWGGSVGLNTTTVVSVNGQGGGGDSHDNYAQTAKQSGIAAEQRLDVKAGGDMTLTGAHLASAGTGSVSVKGNLTVNKLDDMHEKDGLFAGASGGINQGGVNAGINLEKVDQIHNATTQNSTISGVSLQVDGSMRGDNLTSDGGLQTQATTVLKDEKIAGVYVNGTGVVTKSAVKHVVAVLGSAGSKMTSGKKAPAAPDAVVTKGDDKPAPVSSGKHSDTPLPKPDVAKAASPATGKDGDARAGTPKEADGAEGTPKQSKYDTNVVIVTRTKTGEIDKTVQDSANDLAGKHPENTIVLVEKEGGGFENPEALAGATGKVRVNVVGHGSDLKGEDKRVADLVQAVDKGTDANTKIEKVGLVACGGCSKGDEKSLGESVATRLHEQGIDTVVAERSSGLKVNPDGSKTSFDKDGKTATKTEYAVVDGVAKPVAVGDVKRQESVQQDAGRYLAKGAGKKKKEEKQAASAASTTDQKKKVLTEEEVLAVPLVVVNKPTVPASMAGKPVQYGAGESAHAITSQKMTEQQFAEYQRTTLGAGAKDVGVIPVEGLEGGARVTLSRRGSFSVATPMEDGSVSVLRMSSHMTTRAIETGSETVDENAVKAAANLDAPTLVRGNPNAVESTVIGLRYDPEEGLQPTLPTHAEGISGTGLDERAMRGVAKSHGVDDAQIKQEVASHSYRMNRPSADQASKHGTAQTTQVHHSEPMALDLHNRTAKSMGEPPLRERPSLLLFTSIPRQACTNCGIAMATNAHPGSLVSVESRDEFQGFKAGALEFPKEFRLPDDEKPVVGANAALVYKAVPHNTRLYGTKDKPKRAVDAAEVDEVNAVMDFHKGVKPVETKMADEDENTAGAAAASSDGKIYDSEGREIRRKPSRSGPKLEREGSSKRWQQDFSKKKDDQGDDDED